MGISTTFNVLFLWLTSKKEICDVWQKPTQHYKAIILQLKVKLKKKKSEGASLVAQW